MTLSEFALLAGVSPKWVLNAASIIPLPKRYSEAAARRIAIARALQDGMEVPLRIAFRMAGEALRRYTGDGTPVSLTPGEGSVEVTVDMHRLLSEVNVRLSQLRTIHARRRPGPRAPAPRDPLRAASDYGIDLSLLRANLRRTHAERVRQLDGMAKFAKAVHRAPPVRRD